jgi:hypothetical protein
MKEVKSLLIIIGLVALAFIALHYLILFLGITDMPALILLSLPVIAVIAYTTHETVDDMIRSGLTIFGWYTSVILSASALVWFID